MKTTDSLAGSMRRLLANLHPPSPPTARESQQLLNMLQKSFKARLDEQHPAPTQHDFWPKSHQQNDIPVVASSTSSYATRSHLSSILTSPVIGALEGLSTREDAIARFDQLVSKPGLDHSRLTGLLRWYSREQKAGKLRAGEQRHRGESLSDRLNSWLHITSAHFREDFLLNQATRKAALELLNRERKEAIMWTWLRLIYERRLVSAPISSIEWLEVEDDLVSGLMRLSISRNDNNDAAQQFLEACRYRLESGRADLVNHVRSNLSPSLTRPLTISGKRLASAVMFHRHQHGIDSTLFAELLQYLPSAAVNPYLNSAFCAIYSPKDATARHAYGLLQHEYYSSAYSGGLQAIRLLKRKIIMISLLDAARLALDEGQSDQASFILDFAVENFPGYLPARMTEEPEPEIERYFDLIPG